MNNPMNPEALNSSETQERWRSPPKLGEATQQRRSPGLGIAAFLGGGADEEDEPPGTTRKLATIKRNQAAAEITYVATELQP